VTTAVTRDALELLRQQSIEVLHKTLERLAHGLSLSDAVQAVPLRLSEQLAPSPGNMDEP
jgi:hypothetical protein